MEFIIGVGIGVIIAAQLRKRKKHGQKSMPYDPSSANTRSETAKERQRRETDEMVTVVLPTIKNGK